MNQKIQLSIAIPVYNGEKNLKKQFNRIFNECDNVKFKNFLEIVISDNCSSDGTKKIVEYNKARSLKNKNLSIRYFRNNKNLGYFKNFINLVKLPNGKYVLFLSDDDLPGYGFYKKIYDFIKSKNSNTMLIAPIINSNKYYQSLFGINIVSYIINRGSILSGIILNSQISKKYKSYSKSLYPQTELYLDYYLNYGMIDLDINTKIRNIDTKKKISEKINSNDRMQRKSDFALLGKTKIIEKFYKKKKINFFEYFYSIYSVYKVGLNIKMILHKNHHYELEKNFYNKIINVKKKNLIKFIIFLVFLRKIFSKDRVFYLKTFNESLVN